MSPKDSVETEFLEKAITTSDIGSKNCQIFLQKFLDFHHKLKIFGN